MPNALQGLLAPDLVATPRKNKLMGLLADALQSANDYAQRPDPTMPMGKANPVLGLLADAASLGSLATTAQRASYGEPLTNGMRGSKAFLKPETADTLMMAPLSPRNALAALGMVDTGATKAIFAGIGAKTADKAALAKAEKMAAAGADPKAIWRDTGWFKGGDGKWRFEIDDSGAALNRSYTSNPDHYADLLHEAEARTDGVPLGTAFSHPQAFAAYPTAGPLRFKVGGTEGGSFDGKAIRVSDPFAAKAGSPAANPESTVLHELQHAIQEREGFARGGSPENMKSLMSERATLKAQFDRALEQFMTATDPIAKSNAQQEMTHYGVRLGKLPKADSASDAYLKLAGEAEARAVQSRMNLTPQQRRELFPLDSYDVPINSLIYR